MDYQATLWVIETIVFSNFWQELFKQLRVSLCMSLAYHLQTNGQIEVVNCCLETYLRCMAGDRHSNWAKWLPLVEWWYNASFHSTIRMTSFEALYGFVSPLHVSYFPRDSKVEAVNIILRDREDNIKKLKWARDQMKQTANQTRSDRNFNMGDWIFLKFHPYSQHSMRTRQKRKLKPMYFGSFQLLDWIGAIAYMLDLSNTTLIHSTIHLSQLKLVQGNGQPIYSSVGWIHE